MRHRLGITAAPKSYSICRIVNAQEGGPVRHSSLSVVRDDMTGRTLSVVIHVVGGFVQFVTRERCGPGGRTFTDLRESLERAVAESAEDVHLLCAERLDKAGAVDMILREVREHSLAPVRDVKRAVSGLFTKCFGD